MLHIDKWLAGTYLDVCFNMLIEKLITKSDSASRI